MSRDRDPFPFPKYENDQTFTGSKPCQRVCDHVQKLPFKKPTHIAQNEEPWSRLNDSQTFSSMKRSVLYHKEAPKDSLDFHLSAVYDNHLDFLLNKNETLVQRESLMRDHGGNNDDAPKQEDYNMKIRVWVNPQKASIYSTEGAIESPHNASTNRGYSRKHDGGFYST
ncbi:cilia- and flagella-associated protein 276 isoform X1 [Pangasianodon hypophthalmus]|uniref:cilia- and flagella-associated protein 276 isoform X1 n=1 Tax=Pangasianodon hypophthalmus TaxID=310915 RepID=UPI000EFF2FE8|nr:cilia- and flagella-associated protein 276 isoform X1 [Pangasianodon hypophthalmus]